jgi:hypothetical protein
VLGTNQDAAHCHDHVGFLSLTSSVSSTFYGGQDSLTAIPMELKG